MKGYCLPSQDLREKIKSGAIDISYSTETEDRIQTNSYEPILGEKIYWIDEQVATTVRSSPEIPIKDSLDKISAKQKKVFDLTGGYELKVGHHYLIPLVETYELEDDEYIKVSPKSSTGRTFADVRCFADYHPCGDLVLPQYAKGRKVQLWILVQPLIFDVILHPGISLNQIRIFKGIGAKLTRAELLAENDKAPLVHTINESGKEVVQKPLITEDGLILSSCLWSRDFTNKLSKLEVKRGDCFILFSNEYFSVPNHLSAEMKPYSLTNIRGPLHFAGFFDNGFSGDAVIELVSEEPGTIVLSHNAPFCEFEFYRTRETPDKIYGDEKSGSHYCGQKGPKMAKFFKPIDLAGKVALRAKRAPFAIDFTKEEAYDVLDFFDVF